ncbi:hypothetical protein [Xenorhabdus bovienii]|uniref:hypothetical protein n=1 Tax=Xenorhabdus bovienii TaxID=40576 RepID=UPI0023B290BD|nr:hypothetical protein [Xenorhabdus bovienii]MDE9463603.1 hypothetical protein [Xenorhabdus bovienii]MDE9471028.1 hypothetical protein [Xenorhabdus bovienii]MDE9495983.1 hypothetical protein [Xenorhabdus bovienii]MDE9504399.1 hypothetical protein [Xenorhabdus bovienii]MDE9528103.1 hypothetical protein [Xenorhabdus bovienii]
MSHYMLTGFSDLMTIYTANMIPNVIYQVSTFLHVDGMTVIVHIDAAKHDLKNMTINQIADLAYAEYKKKSSC